MEAVVPGDILALKPGTYIAADCRLVEADRLSIDEAALTGESLPALKSAVVLDVVNVPLGDRVNMVYRGTMVTGGQGLALVVATGPFTELGKLQALVDEAVTPATPLEKQLDRVGNEMVLLGCGVCGLVSESACSGLLLQMATPPSPWPPLPCRKVSPQWPPRPWPEGVKKMEQHQVLIRRFEAVETLGCSADHLHG